MHTSLLTLLQPRRQGEKEADEEVPHRGTVTDLPWGTYSMQPPPLVLLLLLLLWLPGEVTGRAAYIPFRPVDST